MVERKNFVRPGLFLGLVLAGFTMLPGCGSEGFGTVSGRVTFDEKPLKGAVVEFHPVASEGRYGSGTTNDNGYYELRYSLNQPGAKTGKNKVKIYYDIQEDDSGRRIPPPVNIPAKYNTDTTLIREVEEGSNQFDFDLESTGRGGGGVTQ